MQDAYRVRLEWGPQGGRTIVVPGGIAVVVDVLSFTTTLSVAADLGIEVVPFPHYDDRARELARRHGAVLALRRADAGPDDLSLSPASFRTGPRPARVVLPSPNGSTISALLAEHDVTVIGAGLRNRRAVAALVTALDADAVAGDRARPVAVVAAGERWPDGTLRPAVEDHWGAGAVISALVDAGVSDLSPEARSAAAAFDALVDAGGAPGVAAALHACSSGVELHELGHPGDVDVAGELDGGVAVPVLADGVFVPVTVGGSASAVGGDQP